MTTIRRLGSGLWRLTKEYPVRAQAIIVLSIAVGTAFGLQLNGIQVGAITGLSAGILAFITEQAVTPTAQPVLPQGTVVEVVTPPDRRTRR